MVIEKKTRETRGREHLNMKITRANRAFHTLSNLFRPYPDSFLFLHPPSPFFLSRQTKRPCSKGEGGKGDWKCQEILLIPSFFLSQWTTVFKERTEEREIGKWFFYKSITKSPRIWRKCEYSYNTRSSHWSSTSSRLCLVTQLRRKSIIHERSLATFDSPYKYLFLQ